MVRPSLDADTTSHSSVLSMDFSVVVTMITSPASQSVSSRSVRVVFPAWAVAASLDQLKRGRPKTWSSRMRTARVLAPYTGSSYELRSPTRVIVAL